MKESTVDLCPVPQEQQPIHEYEALKDTWFFCWATLKLKQYYSKLAWCGFWGWLIAAPIASASFTPYRYPLKFAFSSIFGAILLVALISIRMYLGWSYVRNRLRKDRIFYEESGWYDGQTWLKPNAMIARDRLIVSYQIEPIMQRIRITFWGLVTLAVVSGLFWLSLK
ncbi:CGLD27 family protein [Myxosarcina sp. GI1]|uniref:CGLD27 family protein n=1 Tax=Myxosarcina sp. GI1 TaxID=1541065 RepID=UPI00056212C6|nr:CGLD27 family protein [Myxosarcina sp. GI1]